MCPGFKSLHRHHPLLKKFRKWLKELPLGDGDRVLLAYSGGGDSAGMLALFLSAAPRPDVGIGLCHVDHGLRGKEGQRDEKACAELASSLGLPYYAFRASSAPGRGESVEEWARETRYAFLEECARKKGWDLVATAHSLDDQAETLMMRIARGTGLEGIRGILKVSGKIVRPCLPFRAAELRSAAAETGIGYLEDSTNSSRKFLRNRVRMELMPAIEKELPSFAEGLFRLSRAAASAGGGAPAVAKAEGNSLYYSLRAISPLTAGEAVECFRMGLKELKGDLRGFSRRHLEAIVALLSSSRGSFVPLPGGLAAEREELGVRLSRKKIGALR